MDGYVRFFAQRIPEAEITVSLALLGAGGGSGSAAAVGIGAGLEYDEAGQIAIKAGNGLGFDDQNALAVDQQTVLTTDSFVNEDEARRRFEEMIKSDQT